MQRRTMSAPVKKRTKTTFGDASPLELPTSRELDKTSEGCVCLVAGWIVPACCCSAREFHLPACLCSVLSQQPAASASCTKVTAACICSKRSLSAASTPTVSFTLIYGSAKSAGVQGDEGSAASGLARALHHRPAGPGARGAAALASRRWLQASAFRGQPPGAAFACAGLHRLQAQSSILDMLQCWQVQLVKNSSTSVQRPVLPAEARLAADAGVGHRLHHRGRAQSQGQAPAGPGASCCLCCAPCCCLRLPCSW